MNIYDISKAAGVSIASVSRVINGADNVSERTRSKVMAVIDQYGYTPNAYARGLGRGSMKTIGIMCSDSSDIYLANAIYYLETMLRQNGYNSILCCTGYDLKHKKASLELLKSRQVDAVIMAGSKYVELDPANNGYIIEAAKERPIMLINGEIDAPNIYNTLCDDETGMADAVRRLYESGAREIVYIYSSDSLSGERKIAGIRRGCEETGLGTEHLRIHKGHKTFEDFREILEEEYHKRPFDAVITSSDTSGVGAVKFALSEGLRVPEELQIVSFDNSVLSEACNPELSSIDSSLREICEKTVYSLMEVLEPKQKENQEETTDSGNKSLSGERARSDGEAADRHVTVVMPHLVSRGTTRF